MELITENSGSKSKQNEQVIIACFFKLNPLEKVSQYLQVLREGKVQSNVYALGDRLTFNSVCKNG